MTEQSAVLLVAFLVGLVVAGVCCDRNTEYSTQVCMAIAALATRLRSFILLPAGAVPFLASKGLLSTMPGRALVWLNVWRLHRGFFPCPRYIYGTQKGVKCLLGPGWIAAFLIPNLIGFILIFCSEGLPWALQFCGKPIRGGEAFATLRMLAGFQYRNASQLTIAQSEVKKGGNNLASHKTETV